MSRQLPQHLADYVPVKQRIAEFRKEHPDWSLRCSVQILDNHYRALCDIHDEKGHHIATGSALEAAGKAFDYEKAETSAVGRALVFAGWVDSVELSREEQERSEQVAKPRIKPPPAPEYQIDGLDEPPLPPSVPQTAPVEAARPGTPLTPPRTVKQIATALPVQSAPKAVWRDYIAEFAAATADEHYDLDWKLVSAGKHFEDCTIDDLKLIAVRASDIVKADDE